MVVVTQRKDSMSQGLMLSYLWVTTTLVDITKQSTCLLRITHKLVFVNSCGPIVITTRALWHKRPTNASLSRSPARAIFAQETFGRARGFTGMCFAYLPYWPLKSGC